MIFPHTHTQQTGAHEHRTYTHTHTKTDTHRRVRAQNTTMRGQNVFLRISPGLTLFFQMGRDRERARASVRRTTRRAEGGGGIKSRPGKRQGRYRNGGRRPGGKKKKHRTKVVRTTIINIMENKLFVRTFYCLLLRPKNDGRDKIVQRQRERRKRDYK